ncbi:hypothetical protein [Sulfolobus spindle-shaped virus]|nr:hypothetical protein [Sulfolobus spindle-shaped virus]
MLGGGIPLIPPLFLLDTIQQRRLKGQRNAPLSHRLSFPTYRHNTDLFFPSRDNRRIYNASAFPPFRLKYYGCQNMFISIGNPLIFAVICDELKEDGKKSSEVIIYDNLVSNAFKWTVLYEKAIIKVKQAIGRAIRGPQDSATIYLIDKRFTYKNVMEKMGLEVA